MTIKREDQKAIKVINLAKQFGQLKAVDDISFEVEKGEVFGFLGPNGAGKTTTIRMLTGLTKPTAGQAMIFGYDIRRQTIEAKKRIGVVPERSNVYGDLSAWENLIFTAQLYHVEKNKAKEKAEELLKEFGLFERRKDKAKNFSKGMRRRLTIAMGLINNPQLLFLDEPSAGLDVESSLIIRKTINDLGKHKITVFLTTHDIAEANRSCDRVAIMNHGRIAAIDTPENLKSTIKSAQSIEVTFREKVSFQKVKILIDFPFVREIKKMGGKYKIFTDQPEKALSALWDFSRRNDLRVASLNTLGPSLEEVFVTLVKNK